MNNEIDKNESISLLKKQKISIVNSIIIYLFYERCLISQKFVLKLQNRIIPCCLRATKQSKKH